MLVSRLRHQHQLLESLSEAWEREELNLANRERIGVELEACDADITAIQKLLTLYWKPELYKVVAKLEEENEHMLAQFIRGQILKG